MRKRGPTRIMPLASDIRHLASVSRPITFAQFVAAIFNWGVCLLITFLTLSQLLTAINSTTRTSTPMILGQDPSSGLYQIPGLNDEPYSDRAVVCVQYGRRFKAVTVNDALSSPSILIEDTTGSAIHGYRVVNRSGHRLTDISKQQWTETCRLINATLSYMFSVCESFGYSNVTRDNIRIVNGVASRTIKRIPNSLPILIMPFYDNDLTARYGIPGWDGHTCILRLAGQYENPTNTRKYIFGINRTLRESPIAKWLGRPGGVWKNGWYEDVAGTKWNGDVVYIDSIHSGSMQNRQFDAIAQRELLCHNSTDCFVRTIQSQWAEFQSTMFSTNVISVAISNGARYGLFYYSGIILTAVDCIYDLSAFISDASVIALLCRWMVAMAALFRGYRKGVSGWSNANIGVIANSKSFIVLPIIMYPRLKMIMAAFLSVGCEFEGPQAALVNSWFVMYPSIVDFVLIYASLLNSLAKILRRRMSDSMITPTIIALSLMHFCRGSIAKSPFFVVSGRLHTIIQPNEFDSFTTFDLFKPTNAMRMGGNSASILIAKLVVVAINLLPLLFSENMSTQSKRFRSSRLCRVEKTLTIRACNVGGMGQSTFYHVCQGLALKPVLLNSYEVTRLGYVVIGGRYLITWDSWMILTTTRQIRNFYSLWNYRIMVFRVKQHKENTRANVFQVGDFGEILSLSHPELNCIAWWDIDARPLL